MAERGVKSKVEEAPPEGEVPTDANESCPGTKSEGAGKASACQGCPNQSACASAPKGPDPDLQLIAERLQPVQRKLLVLSGKGGVGKSTVAVQTALALASSRCGNHRVGLLDIDICGPSVPRMLGLEGEEVHHSSFGWTPVPFDENLSVMSIGFMLPNPNSAVVWRGPRKNGLIKQFLKDVDWGELDYLVIDTPPGTSDEHISTAQYLRAVGADGALLVTTPQEVAIADVRKELNFCHKTSIPILGVLENMAGAFFSACSPQCPCPSNSQNDQYSPLSSFTEMTVRLRDLQLRDPRTGESLSQTVFNAIEQAAPHAADAVAVSNIFPSGERGGTAELAHSHDTNVLGRLPLDPSIASACEKGISLLDDSKSKSAAASVLNSLAKHLLEVLPVSKSLDEDDDMVTS